MERFMSSDICIETITLCCFVASGTGKPLHRNRPNYGLAFKCSGDSTYSFEDGTVLTIQAGDLIFLPKTSSYLVTEDTPGDCYAINFQPLAPLPTEPFTMRARDSKQFLALFAEAEAAWKSKTPGYRLRCRSLLYHILYKLQSEHAMGYASSETFRRIRPAVEHLHRHYTTEALHIGQLAAMCHMTPEYFRQIFRKQFGISPLRYINNLKLHHAQELLRSGLYTVTDAALLSGYNDLSHFSREFKRATGLSPSEYRAEKE